MQPIATSCVTPCRRPGSKKSASGSTSKERRLSSPDMLPVAILAGGLATRLEPVTRTIPKALLEVAGKPFIRRQLDYLFRQGVTRVVACVGHLGEQIEAAVGDGRAFGLALLYSYDGPVLLGTGG